MQNSLPSQNSTKNNFLIIITVLVIILLVLIFSVSKKLYNNNSNSNSSSTASSMYSDATSLYTSVSSASITAMPGEESPSNIDDTSSSDTSAKTLTGTTDTTDGLKKATWASNVTLNYTNGQVEYKSNGLPAHARAKEYAVPNGQGNAMLPTASTAKVMTDPSKAQSYDFKITTKPTMAKSTTAAPLGTIGVMISGAALFNPYEGDGKTVALSSNFSIKNSSGEDVYFLDSCNGHPQGSGIYHYHALPTCITKTIDKDGSASHLLGIAFDGFPIYGNQDENGKILTADQLDECNGINSATPEFPDGIYHYVLLDVANSSSSIKCFKGVVDSSLVKAFNDMMKM